MHSNCIANDEMQFVPAIHTTIKNYVPNNFNHITQLDTRTSIIRCTKLISTHYQGRKVSRY